MRMSTIDPPTYPVAFDVDYPDRKLDRLTTFFRPIVAIPILIILGLLLGGTYQSDTATPSYVTGGGLLVAAHGADAGVPPEVSALVVRLQPRAGPLRRARLRLLRAARRPLPLDRRGSRPSASSSPTRTPSATSTAGCRSSSGSSPSRTTSCCVPVARGLLRRSSSPGSRSSSPAATPAALFDFVVGVAPLARAGRRLRDAAGHGPLPAVQPALTARAYPGWHACDHLLRPGRAVARHRRRRGPARGAQRAFDNDPAGTIAYGTAVGYVPLREWIAEQHGVAVEQVLVTNGSMQADAFLFQLLVGPGDPVVVESPTYDRTLLNLRNRERRHAHGRARDRRDRHRGVPRAARDRRPPEARAHHPQLPEPRRLHAVAPTSAASCSQLAAEYDFTIFEDDPYMAIRFEGEPLPTMLAAGRGRQGRLRVLVLQDGLPRHPRRLPRRPGRR